MKHLETRSKICFNFSALASVLAPNVVLASVLAPNIVLASVLAPNVFSIAPSLLTTKQPQVG